MTATRPPRPGIAEPAHWSFPAGERFVLPNGLAVELYERPGQHVVSAGLSLDLPLTAEARELEGVASLLTSVLDQGTATHPGASFAEAVEDRGAVFEASNGFSTTELYLDVPATHLAEALPLLAEALTEPELSDADVERERSLRLAQLEQQRANGSARADLESRAALIDPAFRVSRLKNGDVGTLSAVGGAQVRDFHAAHVGPTGATLVVAGQLPAGVRDMIASALGGWTNPTQASAGHERPTGRPRGAYLIDRPGAVQADVRLGRFTIDRTDPAWPDLALGVYALGGAFLSRLNAVLREEKGYTYGVHASTAPLRSGGSTVVSGSFRTEVAADAVALMGPLLDVRDRPLTEAEIDNARRYITGVQPLQYATASGVCNGVLTLLSAGLPATYVDELRAAFGRVTPETASEAVERLLPPDDLTLLVVGDAAALAPGLRDAGYAVEVIPADGAV